MGRRGALGQPPPCLVREEEGSDPVMHGTPLSSSWDPETEETALLLKFWVPLAAGPAAEQKQNETKDSPPGPPPGEGVVRSPSPDEQFSPSLGRPSQGLLHLRLPPGLAGAWTGWASCLWPAPRRRTVKGCCRGVGAGAATGGRPRRRAGWGAAAGVEAAAGFLQRMMCLIASVCFCAAENCWAQLSTASPKRPVCDTGAFRNCTFSCSFMSVRHSQRWRSWTTSVDIARPRDCAVTFVARSARSVAARGPSQHAAHVEPPGRAHPRAGLSMLWPDGPAVTPWRVGQKPPPHRLYKHCQWGLTSTYRPVRGDTVHPAEWKRLLDTTAWPQTAPQRGCPCTPKRLHHRGWWGGRSHKVYFGQ